MCMKVRSKTDPGINDEPKARSGTTKNWKKSISNFENSESKWNVIAKTGNPTQSRKINAALIESVIKHEIQGNGATSKESRSFAKDDKFKEILKSVLAPEDRQKAMLNHQCQLVGRVGCIARVPV